MGTINYMTSDYITIGVDLLKYDAFYNNDDLIEFAHYHNIDFTNYVSEFINDCIQEDYISIKNILDNYDFYYYQVKIIPGHYAGFSISIEDNYNIYSYHDKIDANKELTQLKKCLLECLKYGLVVVCPAWCTCYLTNSDSKKEIVQAVKSMRADIKKVRLQ